MVARYHQFVRRYLIGGELSLEVRYQVCLKPPHFRGSRLMAICKTGFLTERYPFVFVELEFLYYCDRTKTIPLLLEQPQSRLWARLCSFPPRCVTCRHRFTFKLSIIACLASIILALFLFCGHRWEKPLMYNWFQTLTANDAIDF